ncbi:glycosyltransferase family 4 protein [Nocardia huaxiensis]|uniref:Glycosyltransferase family 4 protein n=1 Tax=Nocardia huaxiensis TaxID=2755382 RepID=A0A7D6VAS2_9NOCA|nr:glycosyltransferase family 4 protein [Nocardia huaxiensis]QLY27715.1 glycosyltransferase family 4 protein [Nocardia huaxiensis]
MGLNVVMIATYPLEPGRIVGGIESVTATLVPALAARAEIDRITVLRFHTGETTVHTRREGPKVEVRYLRGQDRLAVATRSFLDVRQARKIIRELRPDVVHAQEIGSRGDIATQVFPRAVVTVHGLVHLETKLQARCRLKERVRYHLVEAMVRRVLRKAEVVISISGYDAKAVAGMVRGTHVNIANPTAAEFFALAPSGPTEQRLLFAGVLTERKNLEGLLHAFSLAVQQVPKARLIVAGPQPNAGYARAIRARATELGLDEHVEFVGLVDNDRLREEIALARAVVMFSHEETSPTILAQAMAAGKPVLSSRVGGIPEMITDGENGYLVEPQDAGALAQRMVTVLENPELAAELGARGHAMAREKFEPDAVARQTVETYLQVAAKY